MKKPKTKSNFKPKIFGVLIVVLAVLMVGGVVYYNSITSAVSKESETIEFLIVSGDTVDSVIQKLKEANLIKDEFGTKLVVKIKKLNHLKVGGFLLDKSWSAQEIMERLNELPDDNKNTVMITFKEGIWARDFARQISEVTTVSKESLIELWNNEDYLLEIIDKYEFLTEAILNKELKIKLEGYLSPNTYEFYTDTTAEAVTERLLDKTESIYEKYKDEFLASDYTIHELFTLASITQFESGNDEDNKIISGIWYNRLNKDMPLQSSVTVCYAIYDYESWQECESQTGDRKSVV